MTERNTAALREQWPKLCAILMHKLGVRTLTVKPSDVAQFTATHGAGAAVHCEIEGDTATLTLMSPKDAHARAKGGLFS